MLIITQSGYPIDTSPTRRLRHTNQPRLPQTVSPSLRMTRAQLSPPTSFHHPTFRYRAPSTTAATLPSSAILCYLLPSSAYQSTTISLDRRFIHARYTTQCSAASRTLPPESRAWTRQHHSPFTSSLPRPFRGGGDAPLHPHPPPAPLPPHPRLTSADNQMLAQ
jgi:hypothetical protein